MIIDVHNHPEWLGYDFDRYIENMDRYGIDKTWLLSWECRHDEYDPIYFQKCPPVVHGEYGPIPFEYCIKYKEKAPDRFILGYAPDPRRPDAIDRMKAAVSIYGVKVYGEMKMRLMFDNWDAIRMYRYCGENQIPVLVHIDYEFDYAAPYSRVNHWYGGGMEAFERAIAACPETNFIGHAPGFWGHISGDGLHDKVQYPTGMPVLPGGKLPEMLDKYPNLYCDISASGHTALTRDPEFSKKFLVRYQDRVLFGRDEFSNNHQEMLRSFDLPQEVLDKIFYKNACKLVPLD